MLRRPAPPSLALLALLSLAFLPGPGAAQVQRCTDGTGHVTYTDKKCRDIGAEPAPTRRPTAGAVARTIRAARCPRNLQDLVYEITSAIDGHDANQLASIYHWPGMSSSEGYRVMERLAAIADRPLVDVVAVMPATPDGEDGGYYPQATVRQAPIGLRVEQTLANGSTPSRTFFALRRHMDCLWISF